MNSVYIGRGPSHGLNRQNRQPRHDARAGDPDQHEYTALSEHMRPRLYERYVLCAGNDPKRAVTAPQPVDHDAVVPVHDLREQNSISRKTIMLRAPSSCNRNRSTARRRPAYTPAQTRSRRPIRSWRSPGGTWRERRQTAPAPSSARRCRTS